MVDYLIEIKFAQRSVYDNYGYSVRKKFKAFLCIFSWTISFLILLPRVETRGYLYFTSSWQQLQKPIFLSLPPEGEREGGSIPSQTE
jgi:hypothetical protein